MLTSEMVQILYKALKVTKNRHDKIEVIEDLRF